MLVASVSDEFEIDTLLHTDDELSFRRPGVGPDVLRKLRRGEWVIQDEIDLHGCRTGEAARRLYARRRQARIALHSCRARQGAWVERSSAGAKRKDESLARAARRRYRVLPSAGHRRRQRRADRVVEAQQRKNALAQPPLHRGFALFARTNSNYLLDRADKDFSVADLSGARGFGDRFDRALG